MAAEDLTMLLGRGVEEIIIAEELKKRLQAGEKLRLKEGFDPSFPDIHLGHMVALKKLRQFQERGHKVILIVGDWTAQIGDPSGASVTRPMLSKEQVEANARTYMEQFFKVVDKDKTEVRWQSEWFGDFTLADIIKLTSRFTIAQLLARDDFAKRYKAEQPIAITELLYPLLQGYDSVAIKSDVEFGGIDQKFNLLVGRELQQAVGQRPQQCFMTPLLVGTDGTHKMSKSLGNYIGIAEPPNEIYGKVMSIPDVLITDYFKLVTDVTDEEIEGFTKALDDGSVNPMELKKRLAGEIVSQLYDSNAAADAEAHFKSVFQKRELPSDMPKVKITPESLQRIKAQILKEEGAIVSDREVGKPETEHWVVSVPLLLCEIGLAKSRSEARRLIEQEAVRIDSKTVYEMNSYITIGSVINVGPRRWVELI